MNTGLNVKAEFQFGLSQRVLNSTMDSAFNLFYV